MPTVVVKHTGSATETAAALRKRERLWLAAASVVVAFGLLLTYGSKTEGFDAMRAQLEAGTVLDLNALPPTDTLIPFLTDHYADPRDRRFTADYVADYVRRRRDASRFGGGKLPNVGTLNLLTVEARDAYEKGGDHFKARVVREEGFTPDLFARETTAPPAYPARPPEAASGYSITGRVFDAEDKAVPGVMVLLESEDRADTLRTGTEGSYAFTGLAPGMAYRVYPLKPYHLFRSASIDSLAQDATISFQARPHHPSLLLSTTFNRLKPSFVARTPDGFNTSLAVLALLFFGLFWAVHVVWMLRGFRGDPVLLPVVHLLLGLSLLFMLGLPDPLRDRFLSVNVVVGTLIGGVLLLALSLIDVPRWGRRLSYGSAKSFVWLGLAALASVALLTLGTGPAGSGARVNLFGVQPMEAIKACLLVFFAGYFARNWEFLRTLEQHEGLPRWMRRLRLRIPRLYYALPIFVGVAVALLFFYFQHDLGPALVICTTFLVLYGLVRSRWLAVGAGFAGLVGGFWLCYRYELVSTVVSRIRMMLSPWDNFAQGGEHLAHAFWALTAGGLTGHGLGEGNALSIPAAHTDMIVAAIGEELGFLGVLAVLVLYAVLLQCGLTIALRSGSPYGFFLGTGIILATALQLILITGGMLGLIPLSGVVSPFLSYGMAATIMNLGFVGILLSLSAHPGSADQQQLQQRRFGRPVSILGFAILVLLGLLALRAAYIQVWQANRWILQPALVLQADGNRSFVYNPRIYYAQDQIPLGTIYDRNGIPLATSDPALLDTHATALFDLNVDLDAVRAGFDTRRYPFGLTAFYLLGDYNKRVKWGAQNALYAENRYLSRLRGYDNKPEPVAVDDTTITRFDYAPLMPLVRYGLDSPRARQLLEQNRDLYLTIDIRLQERIVDVIEAAVQAMLVLDNRRIAAAVLDAATGEVLASVTYPLPENLYSDPGNPEYFDWAAYATIAPGSTFKIATAMAAFRTMGDEATTWQTTVQPGDPFLGTGGAGIFTMETALQNSNNVFFARLAEEVRAEAMLDVIDAFGFTVYRPDLTRGQQRTRLRQGTNLAQTGFGQGELIGSPLLVARLPATVANQGTMPPITWLRDPNNPPKPAEPIIIPAQARTLAGYMRLVVTSGTARGALGTYTLPIAGKTGTAERQVRGRPGRKINNAWFTGFAPYRAVPTGEPTIAVAVVVEARDRDSGRVRLLGGTHAAPIAGAIFQEAAELGIISGR